MKRLFKWALYLFIIVVVLIVAGVLLLDTIVKEVLQNQLHAETGMEVKIGKMDVGLLTPTIAVESFRLYNPPEFGGSPFLDMPEIYVEYDKDAIRSGKLHFKLVRLDIAEIDVVQDKQGRLNIQGIEEKGQAANAALKSQPSAFTFTGIDTLNVSFAKLRVSSLDRPDQAQEIDFHLTNQVFPNIKSQADLTGMAVVMAGRSASASTATNSTVDMQKILRALLR